MNDLFDALRKAIQDYVHMDDMNPRVRERIKAPYDKVVYKPSTIDSLFVMPEEETDEES
jgi:hypothetical protein